MDDDHRTPPAGPRQPPRMGQGPGLRGGDRPSAVARQGPGRRPVWGEGPGLRRAESTRLGMIDDFRRSHSLRHLFFSAGLPGNVPTVRRCNPVDLTFGQTVFFSELTVGQITQDIFAGQLDPFRKAYCDTTIPPFMVSCQDTFKILRIRLGYSRVKKELIYPQIAQLAENVHPQCRRDPRQICVDCVRAVAVLNRCCCCPQ